MKGAVTLERGNNQFTLGVAGQRNHRLPLYFAPPLAMDTDTIPAASGMANMAQTRTSWQVSARARRTLKRLSGGQTVGVVGEAFVPVGQNSVPRTVISSRAVRAGLVFGF